MLVEVAFKGNRKEFFRWEGEEPLRERVPVVVEADRGEDLGYVYAVGEQAEKRMAGVPHAPEEGVTQSVRRLATAADVHRADELRAEDDEARRRAMERVKANQLVMKLSDAEWRWDRRKLTLYFTAEKRVDFRNLVRELASMFRARIELRQIGVRDEAKRLGGIGRCGREYCSASWLPDLRPVNLGVARDQRLSLNPTQISGACGRLMCCLRYEHEFYVQQRRRFPKEGKVIQTSRGEEKVVANDIFRERVTLRGGDGEVRVVALNDLTGDWRRGGDRVEEDTSPQGFEGLSDELLSLQDTAELPAWVPGRPAGPRGRGRRLPIQSESSPPAHGSPEPAGGRGGGMGSQSPEASNEQKQDNDRPRRRRGRRGGRRGDQGTPSNPGDQA